jgi:hypothetical protein
MVVVRLMGLVSQLSSRRTEEEIRNREEIGIETGVNQKANILNIFVITVKKKVTGKPIIPS